MLRGGTAMHGHAAKRFAQFDKVIQEEFFEGLGGNAAALVFAELGATVRLLPIPLHEGEDQGPDDWLATQVPTPKGDYEGPDVQLARRRSECIHTLMETALAADPVERAEAVQSKHEARQLLA